MCIKNTCFTERVITQEDALKSLFSFFLLKYTIYRSTEKFLEMYLKTLYGTFWVSVSFSDYLPCYYRLPIFTMYTSYCVSLSEHLVMPTSSVRKTILYFNDIWFTILYLSYNYFSHQTRKCILVFLTFSK